jgi:hypothetical protein
MFKELLNCHILPELRVDDDAIRSPSRGAETNSNGEVREVSCRGDHQRRCGAAKSRSTYKSHYSGAGELMRISPKSLKRLVDVAGIEPAPPLLAKHETLPQ